MFRVYIIKVPPEALATQAVSRRLFPGDIPVVHGAVGRSHCEKQLPDERVRPNLQHASIVMEDRGLGTEGKDIGRGCTEDVTNMGAGNDFYGSTTLPNLMLKEGTCYKSMS